MSKFTQVIELLSQHCMTTGLPVEIDRRFMVSQNDNFPQIVVRTGSRVNATPAGSGRARAQLWRMRWAMRPVIEVYLDNNDATALRAEYERIFEEILDAYADGPIPAMLVEDEPIDIEMEVIEPGEVSDIGLMIISFSLTVDR